MMLRVHLVSGGLAAKVLVVLFLFLAFWGKLVLAEAESISVSDNSSSASSEVVKAQLLAKFQCPSPFINDPRYPLGVSNADACQAGCCLVCPQAYSYYEEGALDTGFRLSTSLRVVSAVTSLILVLSYLWLPKKREHPALLILFSALSMFFFSASGFFAIKDPKAVQCADKFTQSTQSNNHLCLIQGTLSIFGAHATVAWLCVLIINLHLHTVWNSHVLRYHYFWLHLFCWGFPFILTAITVGKSAIRYEFGELCSVDHDYADVLYFYPIFAQVIPSFVVHVGTFFYISKISLRAHAEVSFDKRRNSIWNFFTAFRIQWRALALAMSLTISVVFFALIYFDVASLLNDVGSNPQKLSDWSTCLLIGGTQNSCAVNNKSILPSPWQMFLTESVVSAMGIVFFLIFAVQRQFIRDWRSYISQAYRKRKLAAALAASLQRDQYDVSYLETIAGTNGGGGKPTAKYHRQLKYADTLKVETQQQQQDQQQNNRIEDMEAVAAMYGSHGMVDFSPNHIDVICSKDSQGFPRLPPKAARPRISSKKIQSVPDEKMVFP